MLAVISISPQVRLIICSHTPFLLLLVQCKVVTFQLYRFKIMLQVSTTTIFSSCMITGLGPITSKVNKLELPLNRRCSVKNPLVETLIVHSAALIMVGFLSPN